MSGIWGGEREEWEPEEGDDGSEDEYPPRKKAKKGKAKAKVKAAKPKKATTTKTRAQKNSKGSTSKASSSGGHESALNEAKKQFTPGSLIYVREGGMGDWVAGKVVRVYSIRGTITVNWNPRLDDGKYDENPHADNVRNVQTAEEYLAGLSEGSGSGGRLSDSSRKHRARHARMSSAGIEARSSDEGDGSPFGWLVFGWSLHANYTKTYRSTPRRRNVLSPSTTEQPSSVRDTYGVFQRPQVIPDLALRLKIEQRQLRQKGGKDYHVCESPGGSTIPPPGPGPWCRVGENVVILDYHVCGESSVSTIPPPGPGPRCRVGENVVILDYHVCGESGGSTIPPPGPGPRCRVGENVVIQDYHVCGESSVSTIPPPGPGPRCRVGENVVILDYHVCGESSVSTIPPPGPGPRCRVGENVVILDYHVCGESSVSTIPPPGPGPWCRVGENMVILDYHVCVQQSRGSNMPSSPPPVFDKLVHLLASHKQPRVGQGLSQGHVPGSLWTWVSSERENVGIHLDLDHDFRVKKGPWTVKLVWKIGTWAHISMMVGEEPYDAPLKYVPNPHADEFLSYTQSPARRRNSNIPGHRIHPELETCGYIGCDGVVGLGSVGGVEGSECMREGGDEERMVVVERQMTRHHR
ncbi:hypothetical protein FA13DRAFT_1712521 [Coprinellus micaceus]|uniref:Uncharacterized protein n=1 Tax=Coprinellus micaceus TaxID=71717 RepID=A0A4Y7T0Z6_COPMI|nr:hypothetical protein FA13DRAFT_1712521 [Coprinellus micaceus]